MCNGCQFFEELGEEDGGEDFGLIHGDGFGFGLVRRSLRAPAFVCEHDKSQLYDMCLSTNTVNEGEDSPESV